MARQAIVTKFIGPTNYKGSRVKATADAGSITLHWDDALNSEDNHERAALALVLKFGWLDLDPGHVNHTDERKLKLFRKRYVAGGMPQHGNPYAYVFCDLRDGRRG